MKVIKRGFTALGEQTYESVEPCCEEGNLVARCIIGKRFVLDDGCGFSDVPASFCPSCGQAINYED